MRVLVTGGAGFIGSNLTRELLAAGHEVTIFDDLSTGYRDNVAGIHVNFIEGSLLDVASLKAAVQDVDSVVHLAALGSVPRSIEDPLATHAANATGTLQLLEAARARGIDQIVAASSSSVYGMNPAVPKHERDWVRPMSPYAVSKLATEQYVLAYQDCYGFRTLALRFFNVYGPGQRAGHAYAAVIPVFLDSLLRGEALPVNGDGQQSRDFTYVGTVCAVLREALERGISEPEPVNLAYGTNTTLMQLIDEIALVSGKPPEVTFRPSRPGDVRHSRAANARLTELFPDVKPTSLTQGLAETLAWMKENG